MGQFFPVSPGKAAYHTKSEILGIAKLGSFTARFSISQPKLSKH